MQGAHDAEVNSVAFDLTGTKMVTAGSDRKVKVWDTETGLPSKCCNAHVSPGEQALPWSRC